MPVRQLLKRIGKDSCSRPGRPVPYRIGTARNPAGVPFRSRARLNSLILCVFEVGGRVAETLPVLPWIP